MDDLYAFVQQAKARQKAAIEPLPAIRTFETFAYAATNVRDPSPLRRGLYASFSAEGLNFSRFFFG